MRTYFSADNATSGVKKSMSQKTEKIKLIAVAALAVVFVATAYFRFFAGSSPSARRASDPAPAALPAIAANASTETTEVPKAIPVPAKAPGAVYQTPIRDIFKPPVPPPADEPEVVSRMTFKGAILHGGQSVAIIDDAYYHVGDTIGEYEIVSISEKNVRFDSPRGHVTLEMVHDE